MSPETATTAATPLPPNAALDQLSQHLNVVLKTVKKTFNNHQDFVAYYTQIDTDFVYDRRSGLYLVGMTGDHVDLLAALYHYYGGAEPNKHLAADEFVRSGMGLFKSRAGHLIYKGANFEVPSELFSLMRDIEVFT